MEHGTPGGDSIGRLSSGKLELGQLHGGPVLLGDDVPRGLVVEFRGMVRAERG
jgi:hypothetical protein